MKGIIIDDEENARIALSLLIKEHAPQIKLIGSYASLAEANQPIVDGNPDVVFLDIQMPDELGLQLWKYFPQPHFHVVFTTAYHQYALRAIHLSALDYLLKPIDIDELNRVVKKLERQTSLYNIGERLAILEANMTNTSTISQIVLSMHDGLIVVKLEDIIRCESDNNYTRFILQNGEEHLISKTLKEYENMLPADMFLRIHQSHLINLKFVKKYKKGKRSLVELTNGVIIPVSNEKKEILIEMLNMG